VLSIALPDSGTDVARDLATFRSIWRSLGVQNPGVLRDVRSVLCLSLCPCQFKAAVSSEVALTAPPGTPILHLSGESWGRCFNDAFLYAVACDGARFWVHMDDEHVCVRPFWNSARSVLGGGGAPGAHLWQLQVSDDWDDLPSERMIHGDGFTEMVPYANPEARAEYDPEEDCADEEPFLSMWPVFSLRPSVMKLHHFRAAVASGALAARPFDEESGWATLQWRLGVILESLGGRKGVLNPPAFFARPPGEGDGVSTEEAAWDSYGEEEDED